MYEMNSKSKVVLQGWWPDTSFGKETISFCSLYQKTHSEALGQGTVRTEREEKEHID